MGKWPQTKYYPSDFPAKITVIRCHHPLEGQALERLSVGKAWVVVRLGDGSSMKLPRGWTDADGGPCTELTGCCLSDYFTVKFPDYFAADSAWIPTMSPAVG